MQYKRELDAALDAAERAGEIMDRYQENGVAVKDTKDSHLDIVTAADHECQDSIVEKLSEEFPQDGFIGEEDLEDSDSNRVWIIDPIDGTTNFQRGFPYYCTSIALRIDGEMTVGVVHSPESALGRTFAAVQDYGAFEIVDSERREISVSDKGSMKGAMTVVGEDEHAPRLQPLVQETQKQVLNSRGQLRHMVAGALDISMVAAGGFDACLHHCRIWDMAAASVILEEAGGKVDFHDREMDNMLETVSTNGKIQEEFVEIYEGAKHETGVWFSQQG
jgi:myo-inositol-1(or 4)-monophosphatase